jgi:hypothetical protein
MPDQSPKLYGCTVFEKEFVAAMESTATDDPEADHRSLCEDHMPAKRRRHRNQATDSKLVAPSMLMAV